MPQALPLLPQFASLDGRAVEARPRPGDRPEHRQQFDRLLDRFSRPEAANEPPYDPVKEPANDTASETPREPSEEQVAEADGGAPEADAAPASDAPAKADAAVEAVTIILPAAAGAIDAQAAAVAAAAVGLVAPSIPGEAVAPANAAASVEVPVIAAAPLPAASAPVPAAEAEAAMPVAAANGQPVATLPSGPTVAATATDGIDKKPALAGAAQALETPAFAELAAERKIDPAAAPVVNEPTVGAAEQRAAAKTKTGQAAGIAEAVASLQRREDRAALAGRSDHATAAFAADSPRQAAALYNKVADAARPADAPAPADQLSMRLLHAVADGKRAIQVHLHPAELGAIDVKMQWQGDRLTAQFLVDRPETLQLLQRDLPSLERSLSQAGVNVDSGSLQFSLRQQQDQGRSGGQAFAAPRGAGAEPAAPRAADEPLGQIVRDGLLSIRV